MFQDDGNTIIVFTGGRDTGIESGEVLVYVRKPQTDIWKQRAMLSQNENIDGYFGQRASISEKNLAVYGRSELARGINTYRRQ